jgi:hypothetical protein
MMNRAARRLLKNSEQRKRVITASSPARFHSPFTTQRYFNGLLVKTKQIGAIKCCPPVLELIEIPAITLASFPGMSMRLVQESVQVFEQGVRWPADGDEDN